MLRHVGASFLGCVLLMAACSGGDSGTAVSTTTEDGLLRVITYDRQDFDADLYKVPAGQINIEYVLSGVQAHTLVVEGLEEEFRLEVGDKKVDSGSIRLTPGRYVLYCDIAGHRSSGMEARLLVT
tara:strand:- start:252 stop:626 length:375 start_codon:yes stop_codon:yes gene_type:complete